MNEIEEWANTLAAMTPEEYDQMADEFELSLEGTGQLSAPEDFPVKHYFGDGIYQRMINLPTGSLLTSKIHTTKHPFVVHCGAAFVISPGKAELIVAPYSGMTQPGTRRIILSASDCVWSTFHANPDNEDVAKIEDRIILKRKNLLLEEPQPCLG